MHAGSHGLGVRGTREPLSTHGVAAKYMIMLRMRLCVVGYARFEPKKT